MAQTEIAYLKMGDVVRELEQFSPDGQLPKRNGPFVYAWGLLHFAGARRVLLLSPFFSARRLQRGKATAINLAYNAPSPFPALRKILVTLQIFLLTLLRRPRMILCAYAGPPLWFARIAATLSRSKFVYIRHTVLRTGFESRLRALLLRLDDRIIRTSDQVIGHGPFLIDQLRAIGVPEDRLHNYWLPLADFAASEKQPDLPFPLPKRFFLYAGRLDPTKGIFDLLEAAAPLLERDPDLHLVYAGDGPARAALAEEIDRRNLTGRALLTGRIEHDALPFLLRRCLFLASPTWRSLAEGRCMSVVEALIFGRPVVAPDYGAFRHYLDRASTLLYEPDSVEALSAAMRRLLDDPELHAALCAGAAVAGKAFLDPHPNFLETLPRVLERVGVAPR